MIRSWRSLLSIARIKKAAKFGLNIARERDRINSQQGAASKSRADLYRRDSSEERTRLCYIDDSRTLLCLDILDTTLAVIAAITFPVAGCAPEPNDPRSPRDCSITRRDFIVGRLFVSCLGFIRLDKGSPAERLREGTRRQRRVTAAINDRAASQQSPWFTSNGLIVQSPSSRDKNHFRKLDGPQASTVRLYNFDRLPRWPTISASQQESIFDIRSDLLRNYKLELFGIVLRG